MMAKAARMGSCDWYAKLLRFELMGFDNQLDEAGDVRIGEKGMKDDIQIPCVD